MQYVVTPDYLTETTENFRDRTPLPLLPQIGPTRVRRGRNSTWRVGHVAPGFYPALTSPTSQAQGAGEPILLVVL